jgi:hypothetical protein
LLDEGLRMADHPGIVFRSGPGGRRARLARGPDVWEVVRVFRGAGSAGAAADEATAWTAEVCGLEPAQVRVVLRYYAEYPDEIDTWLERLDEEASRAEAMWRREQALLLR